MEKHLEVIQIQGRKFKTVPIDESFPKYLVENISKYKAYIKT